MSRESKCPDHAVLERFLLGQLPDPEVAQVEQHLEHCDVCGDTVRELNPSDTLMESIHSLAETLESEEGGAVDHSLIEQVQSQLTGMGPSALPAEVASLVGGVDEQSVLRQLAGFLDPPAEPDEIARLGPYRLLSLLGVGGMGVVFLAEDPRLRRSLAVKVMKPELVSDSTAKKRFLREAQAAASIESDHIVTIHQVGEHNGMPFLAMQRLKGETLEEHLSRKGVLPQSEVIRIGLQIAAGLAAAHDRGLIHRDIKPANVWIESPGGRVKLLDFGLARACDDTSLTQTTTMAGTPSYMAPEQAAGRPVDQRCDLFALGCVLYRMCTDTLPFTGPDKMAVIRAIDHHHPRPPRMVNSEISGPFSDLVMKLLDKEPNRRPRTVSQVHDALHRMVHTESDVEETPPRRRRIVTIGVAAVLALVAATVLYVRTGMGILVLEVNVSDATITVDDNEVEFSSPRDEIHLTVGPHMLSVRKDGFTTHTKQFRIRRGGKEELVAKLQPTEPHPGEPESRPLGASQQKTATVHTDSSKPVDLLSLVKVQRDALSGTWSLDGSVLATPATLHDLLHVPFVLPEEFDLDVVLERKSGNDYFTITVDDEARHCQVILDGWPSETTGTATSGLQLLDEKDARDNGTTHIGRVLPKDKQVTLRYSFRQSGILVTCDGQTIIAWKGDNSQLTMPPQQWELSPSRKGIFIGSFYSVFHIHKLLITRWE